MREGGRFICHGGDRRKRRKILGHNRIYLGGSKGAAKTGI